MADGVTITANVPGAPDTAPPDTNYTCSGGSCTFLGAIGLAPRWADHKLDNKGGGWVSACVLARCNAHNDAVSISLRGRSTALGVAGDEILDWPLEEGAFYGDVFDAGDPNTCLPTDDACNAAANAAWLVSHSNACSGKDNFVAASKERDCAVQDGATGVTQCGFNYAGNCRDTTGFSSGWACAGFTGEPGGYYMDCHDVTSNSNGRWKPHSAPFREVITTYVAN